MYGNSTIHSWTLGQTGSRRGFTMYIETYINRITNIPSLARGIRKNKGVFKVKNIRKKETYSQITSSIICDLQKYARD